MECTEICNGNSIFKNKTKSPNTKDLGKNRDGNLGIERAKIGKKLSRRRK